MVIILQADEWWFHLERNESWPRLNILVLPPLQLVYRHYRFSFSPIVLLFVFVLFFSSFSSSSSSPLIIIMISSCSLSSSTYSVSSILCGVCSRSKQDACTHAQTRTHTDEDTHQLEEGMHSDTQTHTRGMIDSVVLISSASLELPAAVLAPIIDPVSFYYF